MRSTGSIIVAGVLALSLNAAALAAPGGNNSTPIVINDNANASLYPSAVTVTGPLTIQSLSVNLRNVTHARLADLTMLLVSPTGKKIQLMANAPGSASATDVFLVEEGGAFTGDTVDIEHTYHPTVIPAPVAMPAPAPALPYETSFGSLIGTDAGGTWSLYVRDNVSGQAGTIADGWAIGFNGLPGAPLNNEFTYQGRVTDAGGPVSGVRDIQLSFYRSPIATLPQAFLGAATAYGVSVQSGLFSARFSPPDAVFDAGVEVWAEIGVKAPGDPSFTVLAPRQQMTCGPFASLARRALSADSAQSAASIGWAGITGVPANVLNAFSPWASVNGTSINNTNTGNVLIGTTNGSSKLTVNGVIESFSGGFRFPDGTVQLTAASPASVVLSAAASIDFGSIAAGAEVTASVGVAGTPLSTGSDVVAISPQSDLSTGLSISSARVNSATQIKFVVRNNTAAAINPPATIFTIKVIR